MAQIKYTKTELRNQQVRLGQLEQYLPTLQLKKAMLQAEIDGVTATLSKHSEKMHSLEHQITRYQKLFTSQDAPSLFEACEVDHVKKRFENIAGVDIPVFEGITFKEPAYHFFDTEFWLESGIDGLRELVKVREKIYLLEEMDRLLRKELREVSIRVNLFEKIMIPRTKGNIKKIKIFLGDQELASVCQAKVSKQKILKRKEKV